MKPSLKFALTAALLTATLGITGCEEGTADPYTPQPEQTTGSHYKLQKIANGEFFKRDPVGSSFSSADGMYKLTIDADKAGTPNDLNCLVINQSVGLNRGIATMSCDYVAAHAPKTPVPVP